MCKVDDQKQNVDYIFCLSHEAVQTTFKPLEVTDTTISCSIEQMVQNLNLDVEENRSKIPTLNQLKKTSQHWQELANLLKKRRPGSFLPQEPNPEPE